MEFLDKDGVLHILNEDPPEPQSSTVAAVNKSILEDQNARAHIALNFRR